MTQRCRDQAPLPVGASLFAAAWAFLYALYRGYYALGGTAGMFGTPVSEREWRLVNAVGAAIILAGAVAPLALLKAWRSPNMRPVLLALCWIVTVGCVMHALVNATQRVLSLSGMLRIDYPFWTCIDRRQADLQDLLFNEPWFLIEGLLWGMIAWTADLNRSRHRIAWITSAVIATLTLTVIGLLSAFGVIGELIVG